MKVSKINSKFILFSLWLLMFSSSSQFLIVSPILSQISEQLNIPQALGGTLMTSYAITLGLVALVTGPISDKIGRRKILLFGTGAMSASLLLHQFAFDYYSILLFRILAGFAGGILTGSCVAYIGDYFPKKMRGWANGVVATGSAAGQILGIPAGTLLSDWMGFYAPFQFFGIAMALAFIMIYFMVPQPQVKLSNCSLNFISIGKGYVDLLKTRQVRIVALGYMLMFFSITVFIVYFPTWLENEFSATSYDIALMFFAGGLATVFTGPLSGKISDRTGRKQIIIFANLLLVIAMPVTAIFLNLNSSMYSLVFFMIMLFVVARMVPFQALASEIIHDDVRGRMMSLTIAIGQLGMALGSFVSGFVFTEVDFVGNATLAAIASFLMAFLIQRFITEPKLVVQES